MPVPDEQRVDHHEYAIYTWSAQITRSGGPWWCFSVEDSNGDEVDVTDEDGGIQFFDRREQAIEEAKQRIEECLYESEFKPASTDRASGDRSE